MNSSRRAPDILMALGVALGFVWGRRECGGVLESESSWVSDSMGDGWVGTLTHGDHCACEDGL